MSAPPIWFVRHGQTDWNVEGRLQGQRDIPLNPTGLAQAEEAAARLRRLAGGQPIEAEFVASPLGRARQTMERLRTCLDLPASGYRVDARFQELGFGDWEGATWAEIRRRDRLGAAARERDRWGFRPPGDTAESYAMLRIRVDAAVADLTRPTILVAHGGVGRALLVSLGRLDPSAAARIGIRQGRVLVLEGDGWRWA